MYITVCIKTANKHLKSGAETIKYFYEQLKYFQEPYKYSPRNQSSYVGIPISQDMFRDCPETKKTYCKIYVLLVKYKRFL